MASKTPDQYNSNAKVADPDGTAHQFFVQQWNLLLAFVKSTVADFADVISAIAAAKAVADKALAKAQAANADTGVTAGTYGDATNVGQFTVGANGRITAAANVPITGGGGGASPFWATAPTPPVSAGFTTIVGGTGSLTDVTRGITISVNRATAAIRNLLGVKTPPAATWTATALFVSQVGFGRYDGFGIVWRDSATGKHQTAVMTTNTVGMPRNPYITSWSATDTFAANDVTTSVGYADSVLWVRAVCDATNITMYVSVDGVNWEGRGFVAKNSYVANINQVGFFITTNSTDITATTQPVVLTTLMSFDLV